MLFNISNLTSTIVANLYAWGLNATGQLGIPGGTQTTPQLVGNLSWAQVSAGQSHTLAIRSDRLLFAWGGNIFGQLGNGESAFILSRQNNFSWVQVSSGAEHGAAIRSDGALFTWGRNDFGQLGDGTIVDKSSPVQIGTSSWSKISSGENFTLAIRVGGSLFAWGRNNFGQLGDGTIVDKSSPVQIGALSWFHVSASCGGSVTTGHSAGLTRNAGTNTLFTWGLNTSGQLGDGTTVNKSSPVQIGADSWDNVSAGGFHTLAIRSTGYAYGPLYSWGRNDAGQLGLGNTTNRSSPVQIGANFWTDISGGLFFSAAISASAANSPGILFTWGENVGGQLGLGDTIGRSSPVQVGTSLWTKVSAGRRHTLAIRADGALFSWGYNDDGQLGDGTRDNTVGGRPRSSPVQVGTSSWTQVSAGHYLSSAIRADRALFTSGGRTSVGRYVAAGNPHIKSSPIQIGTSSWTQVFAGRLHNAAIRSDSLLFTWGSGIFGGLGNNTTLIARESPTQIGTSSWAQVSAGGNHTAGITISGLLFTWGRDDSGQLGLGNRTDRSSPVQVGASLWTQVSTGYRFTSAIRSDGSLFSWGQNNYGQLGDGTTVNKSSPVQIGTSSWAQVSSGTDHALAIRSDRLLFAWGLNTIGQLGDGTIVNKSSPVQIGTSSWAQVSSCRRHTLAIRSDRLLFAWGLNLFGQLGDGTTVNKSSPVQIGTSSWAQVSSGHSSDHTVGLTQ